MEPYSLPAGLALPATIVGLCCVLALATIWCLGNPQRAFLLVIFSTPFIYNPTRDRLLMRVGLPEVVFVFFFFVWIWSLAFRRRPFRPLRMVHLFALLFLLVAAVSFVGADPEGFSHGVIEVLILGYLVIFCLIADQFMSGDDEIKRVLDVWMLAAALVAIIGLYECVAVILHLPRLNRYRDEYRVIATFRRPPQLGVYALSSFFVAVAYSMVPDLPARKRLALRILAAAMVVLIVFSSRRSALASLAVGMFLILVLHAGELRRAVVLGGLFALAVFGAHQLISSEPTLREFFTNRLRVLYNPGEEGVPFIKANFDDAVAAFHERPLLGIGYGHFAGSDYSSTGNEIHSTPLRVLAECGTIGALVYLAMTCTFLYLAWRNVRLARGTIWVGFAQVIFPGMVALQVSYLYNRALRDRTYWLLIALTVALHSMLAARRREALAGEAEPAAEWDEGAGGGGEADGAGEGAGAGDGGADGSGADSGSGASGGERGDAGRAGT
ncbi:MAG TPA: O-antigen ligase family protein [Planctomycetota bacterium]|nr:O-antigen ligase family protein [Planctomycetota bacterium]